MKNGRYNPVLRYIHAGLVVFGIGSLLTAEMAEESGDLGFWIHSGLGILLSLFILVRILAGLFAISAELKFRTWWDKLSHSGPAIKEDLRILIGLSVPDRELHGGIAGIVQAFGLFTFTYMCITGLLLLALELGGVEAFEHLIEEAHEVGQGFIIGFLILHIGAVVLHYIKGENLIKRINPF